MPYVQNEIQRFWVQKLCIDICSRKHLNSCYTVDIWHFLEVKIPIHEPKSYLDLRSTIPQIISSNKCLLHVQLDCYKYLSHHCKLNYPYVIRFPFRYWPLNLQEKHSIFTAEVKEFLRSTEINILLIRDHAVL